MTSTPELPSPASEMTPAASLQQLKALFPALFDGPVKPLKLRIQADIQQRAPGQFSKQQLSAALRRLTGSTAYLVALSKGSQRFDLDGQPSGELAAEHREAAQAELARRRELHQQRREQEQGERRQRAALLRAFQTTTLTRANFCALKGIDEAALDGVLAQAAREIEEDQQQRSAHAPQDRRRPGPGNGKGPGDARRGGPRREAQPRRGGPSRRPETANEATRKP